MLYTPGVSRVEPCSDGQASYCRGSDPPNERVEGPPDAYRGACACRPGSRLQHPGMESCGLPQGFKGEENGMYQTRKKVAIDELPTSSPAHSSKSLAKRGTRKVVQAR